MSTVRRLSGWLLLILFSLVMAHAQDRPFLFTIVPSGAPHGFITLHYDAAYGRQTFEPFGGGIVEQTLGFSASVTEDVVILGKFGVASDASVTHTSQHVEILARVIDGSHTPLDVSIGPGFRHEYSGTNVLLGRVIAGKRFTAWQVYGNALVEKAFANARDGIDLFLTAGFAYELSPLVRLGLEGVGQDLEGFWDSEEAEGGATLFFGPTLSMGFPGSSLTVNAGAGPIIRATHNLQTSVAPRDLPVTKDNGFIVRLGVNWGL